MKSIIVTVLFLSFFGINSIYSQTLAQNSKGNTQVNTVSNAADVATVYIVRPNIYPMSARKLKLNVGTKENQAIKVKNNSWQEIKVMPGNFSLQSINKGLLLKNETLNLQLEAGKEYYIYAYWRTLFWTSNVEFVEMSTTCGKNKLDQLKNKK
jgi:hypothetical protein